MLVPTLLFLCFKIQNTNIFIFEGYGIATSKSSGLHVSINQALLNLKNQRIPQSLENKWWTSECPSGDSYIRGDLSLANVVGVFFFLAALLVLGMVLHTIFGQMHFKQKFITKFVIFRQITNAFHICSNLELVNR